MDGFNDYFLTSRDWLLWALEYNTGF